MVKIFHNNIKNKYFYLYIYEKDKKYFNIKKIFLFNNDKKQFLCLPVLMKVFHCQDFRLNIEKFQILQLSNLLDKFIFIEYFRNTYIYQKDSLVLPKGTAQNQAEIRFQFICFNKEFHLFQCFDFTQLKSQKRGSA